MRYSRGCVVEVEVEVEDRGRLDDGIAAVAVVVDVEENTGWIGRCVFERIGTFVPLVFRG